MHDPYQTNVIPVPFDMEVKNAIMSALTQGMSIEEIAIALGTRDSVVRMTILRMLGKKRAERPPSHFPPIA